MPTETLGELIEDAVADYGFRLAVMWGTEDVIIMSSLSQAEAGVLRSVVVPELKRLPDPVEPGDQPSVCRRLLALAEAELRD